MHPCSLVACSLLLGAVLALQVDSAAVEPSEPKTKSALSSIFVDDVVVESTLSVRRKAGARQGRGHPLETAGLRVDGSSVLNLKRTKRQGRRNRFPNSQQGAAGFPQGVSGFSQGGFPQGGFPQNQKFPQGNFPAFQPLQGSASSAAAQAQGFESAGPLGAFGASSAGAGSQGFSYDQSGIKGNAGLSGSQSYHLPNGQTLALSYANGFSIGPDGKPVITKGNSIAYSGPDGKPVPGFNPQGH